MLAGDFLRLLLTDLSARVKDDIIIDRMRGTKQGKPSGGKRAKEGQMNECPYGAKEKWLKRNPKAKPYRMQKATPSFVRLNEVRNDKQGHGNQKQRQGEKNKRKNPEGSDEDDLDGSKKRNGRRLTSNNRIHAEKNQQRTLLPPRALCAVVF